MGQLNLVPGSCVYLDTPITIYSADRHATYAPLCDPLWHAAQDGTATLVTSELTLLESAVRPFRENDPDLLARRHSLWSHANTILFPITREILLRAAELRAQNPALRTPDAIHCATAEAGGCSMLVTNDRRMHRGGTVPLVALDDAV